MITGYASIESAVAAVKEGAENYLPKPFSEDQLLGSVEKIAHDVGLIYTNESELNRLIGQRIRQERLSQNLTEQQSGAPEMSPGGRISRQVRAHFSFEFGVRWLDLKMKGPGRRPAPKRPCVIANF